MPPLEFIHQYFNAEKKESLLFIILGVLAIVGSILLFAIGKTNFYKGMAIPFILVGLIHVVVGYTVYKKSDGQRVDISYKYGINGGNIPAEEQQRMDVVMKNFVVYRYTEIALAIVGLGLVFVFKNNIEKSFWYGLGMALAIEALFTLGLDYFAERRGHNYLKGFEQKNMQTSSSLNPNSK